MSDRQTDRQTERNTDDLPSFQSAGKKIPIRINDVELKGHLITHRRSLFLIYVYNDLFSLPESQSKQDPAINQSIAALVQLLHCYFYHSILDEEEIGKEDIILTVSWSTKRRKHVLIRYQSYLKYIC